jgi:hypothetical protein
MANILAIPGMRGPNHFVPNMQYASDVEVTGMAKADLGIPVTASANGILNAQSIATAGATQVFAATYNNDSLSRYGRVLQLVASAVSTSVVTVQGFDFWGQPLTEAITLNGTTVVIGVKAFRYVTRISWTATAATTMSIGWVDRFGLPYRAIDAVIQQELVNDAPVGVAGTITVGALPQAAQTNISIDPRGLYVPNVANPANGARKFSIMYHVDNVLGLMGARHFGN